MDARGALPQVTTSGRERHFGQAPRKQSLVGLLLPVIDSFGESRRSRASGHKLPSGATRQMTDRGWLLTFSRVNQTTVLCSKQSPQRFLNYTMTENATRQLEV